MDVKRYSMDVSSEYKNEMVCGSGGFVFFGLYRHTRNANLPETPFENYLSIWAGNFFGITS